MTNYMKSEFYRLKHSSTFWGIIGLLVAIAITLNQLMAIDKPELYLGNDLYYTTDIPFRFLLFMPFIYCLGSVLVAYAVYEGNMKNGNLKNSIAFGISRTSLFLGRCIVSSVATLICLVISLFTYIIVAIPLFGSKGTVTINDLLLEALALLLITLSTNILAVLLLDILEKKFISFTAWLFIIIILPVMLSYIGTVLNSSLLLTLASWCPIIFLRYNVWATSEGLLHCLLSGALFIVLFLGMGIALFRQKSF